MDDPPVIQFKPKPDPPPKKEEEVKDDGYLAPELGKLVNRRVSLPNELWEEVIDMAKAGGSNYQDLLACLIDLGMRAQALGEDRPRRVLVETGIHTRIELLREGQTPEFLGEVRIPQVPAVGEAISFQRAGYVVEQRAWRLKEDGATAFLRVKRFGKKKH